MTWGDDGFDGEMGSGFDGEMGSRKSKLGPVFLCDSFPAYLN